MKVHLEGTPEEIQEFLKKQASEKKAPVLPTDNEKAEVIRRVIQDERKPHQPVLFQPWSKEEDAVVLAEYKPKGTEKTGQTNKELANKLGRTYAAVGWRYRELTKGNPKPAKAEKVKAPISERTKKLLNDWNALKADFNKRSQEHVTVRNKAYKKDDLKKIRELANNLESLSNLPCMERVFELSKELGRTFYSVLGEVSKRRR